MPIAELLGVQFDMQMLLKLSLSVAAVLLVSWAYRFYSSRDAANPRLHVDDGPEPREATCRNCKVALQPPSSLKRGTGDGGRDPKASQIHSAANELTPATITEQPSEAQPCRAEDTKNTSSASHSNQDIGVEGEIMRSEESISNIYFGSTLNFPSPRERGMGSPTGRRSPCFLQRLEGSVGVGRELRQHLERQGGYSSFISKAEIKVGDANLVLNGKGDQVVRGKIYDYYVESSSHSITNSIPVLRQYERNSADSQEVQLLRPPPSRSPLVMRDMIWPHSAVDNPFPPATPEPRQLTRPVLLRKESYLSAAENSELPVSFPNPTTSPSMNHSRASSCVRKAPNLATIAGAPFLQLPAENLHGAHLEGLKGKLDLGNCMEVLGLAKKHGEPSLQQAALGVMSDNYLQVLREPSLYGRLMAGEREQIQKQRMNGRRFVVVADIDPQDWTRNTGRQTTGVEQRTASSALYYYDDYKDAWHLLCPLPREVVSNACAMCTMDNYLFVVVGCQGTEREMIPSKRVFCYNPVTSIWKEISPMNEARPNCKLAALHGYVYAIGGECLSTVERYDPRTGRWSFVAPLPNDTFAVAHRATVCNGEIFVSGGTLRYALLRYNPKSNTWRESLIVGIKDRTTEMVAVRSFLYRFDVNPLMGVGVSRYHAVTRLWYECSSKRLLRCPAFQCVALEDSIFCISHQFTMRFLADEISPAFIAEDLSVLSAAKGILFPFVLSLPDKKPFQTCV